MRRAAAVMAMLALALMPLRPLAACPMDDASAAGHGLHHDAVNHEAGAHGVANHDVPQPEHPGDAACQDIAGCAAVAHPVAAVRVLPVMERHAAIAVARLPMVDGPTTSLEPPPPKS